MKTDPEDPQVHIPFLRSSLEDKTPLIKDDSGKWTTSSRFNLQSTDITNGFFMLLNIVSSIGVVTANKWVFAKEKFKFGTLLTVIHFATTFLGLLVCASMGVFRIKRLPLSSVFPISASFSAFVVLTNLSLQQNSVSFYQMAKVLTTPCIIIIQTVIYRMKFTTEIKLSLIVTCMGVMLAYLTDVQTNLLGTLYALSGVVTASLYQIWISTNQADLNANSCQLLVYQAPISALMLLFSVPILDDFHGLLSYKWTFSTVLMISISAIFAFFVNLSTFLVIGKTSPVTYNVIGHLKLMIIITMGYIVFDSKVVLTNLIGVFITVIGVIWYSLIKLRPSSSPSKS